MERPGACLPFAASLPLSLPPSLPPFLHLPASHYVAVSLHGQARLWETIRYGWDSQQRDMHVERADRERERGRDKARSRRKTDKGSKG